MARAPVPCMAKNRGCPCCRSMPSRAVSLRQSRFSGFSIISARPITLYKHLRLWSNIRGKVAINKGTADWSISLLHARSIPIDSESVLG